MSFGAGLYGSLALASLGAVVLFAGAATVYVVRLIRRQACDADEGVGSSAAVMKKIRKGQSLSDDEATLARQVIADRRSPLAYAIPAALFTVGCFYVLGSLEHLHGATPSERTFLGVIPMLTAANLTLQLLRSARLRVPAHRSKDGQQNGG